MGVRQVGIRELKAKLSQCLRQVKSGSAISVTERGRRVARLVPDSGSLGEQLATLKDAGAILWSGKRLRAARPGIRSRRKRSVADILVESRR